MRMQEQVNFIMAQYAMMSHSDFIKQVCGDILGEGSYRDVYAMKDFPKLVIKIERSMDEANFANVTEFRNYINNRFWLALKDWLAPCWGITSDGVMMIQRRVTFRDPKHYPALIPSVFTDTKYSNYGWIGKKFVACDYSFLTHSSFRMKKVVWKNC